MGKRRDGPHCRKVEGERQVPELVFDYCFMRDKGEETAGASGEMQAEDNDFCAPVGEEGSER